MIFKDRREAGQKLAELLQSYKHKDVVIYALPRGGVILGAEVAQALDAPLDLSIPRKVGHPTNPEYAIAAVTENGSLAANQDKVTHIDQEWFKAEVAKQRQEAKRRRELYLKDRPAVSAEGKIAIIVDDGIATGLTLRAAIQDLKQQIPKKVVIAVPVAPKDVIDALKKETDEVFVVIIPDEFMGAVGSYYQYFPQVTDEEVITLLQGQTNL